jgi:hypothetical protein
MAYDLFRKSRPEDNPVSVSRFTNDFRSMRGHRSVVGRGTAGSCCPFRGGEHGDGSAAAVRNLSVSQRGPTPCTGICLNKEWQPQTDAIRFVRDRELACYRGWGLDSWQPRNGGPLADGPGGSNPSGSSGGGSYSAIGNRPLAGAPVIPLTPIHDAAEIAD